MGCGLVRLRMPSGRHTAPRDAYPLQMVPPTVKRAGFNFDYFLQTMSTVHKPGQHVSVTLANGRTCTGVIYTIDPVSEAFYIATQRARRRHAMVIVMKHAIRSVEVAGACSEEEMDRIIGINFKSLMMACQIFGARMLQGGGGSIINIGSISALVPLSRVFIYSASKAAVHNLSKNLAREWAPRSLRVNTLVPGFFPAEQNRKVLTPERVDSIMARTPMKRFGEARELVGATLLLASDAGSFITGSEIVVDGGFASMAI